MPDVKFLSGVFKEAKQTIGNLIEGFAFYAKHEVVVGITQESNSGHKNGPTSAELLYLHEKGVPSHNIPPRPVLKPALAQPEVQKAIKSELRKAMIASFVTGNKKIAEMEMEKAGMLGRDACKKYIADGNKLAPNAPATIAKKGSSKPLIDTGAMMNSITYAVKEK